MKLRKLHVYRTIKSKHNKVMILRHSLKYITVFIIVIHTQRNSKVERADGNSQVRKTADS